MTSAWPAEPVVDGGRNLRAAPVSCFHGAFAVGFDPYLGFYHRPRFGRPALALDLAEEFRPLIAESVVLNLINNGEIRSSQLVVRAGGVALTPEGRRAVLAAYERRLDTEIPTPRSGTRSRTVGSWMCRRVCWLRMSSARCPSTCPSRHGDA